MRTWIVTGGIGTGKSSFCNSLAQLACGGMVVFSSDKSVHGHLEKPEIIARLGSEFGASVVTAGGAGIDRTVLRELVFKDEQARLRLEGLLHPLVFADLAAMRAEAETSAGVKVFLAEVPLYYEIEASVSADEVIVVAASRAVQRARIMERQKVDESTCDRMLNAQLPMDLKMAKADVVVWNDGFPALLEAQALALLRDRCG